jgi:hypothetical protein
MRVEALKSAFSPFRVFSLFYDEYWSKDGATPEERYVLRLCKDVKTVVPSTPKNKSSRESCSV